MPRYEVRWWPAAPFVGVVTADDDDDALERFQELFPDRVKDDERGSWEVREVAE